MFIIGVKLNKQNQLANVILSKDVCAILQNSQIDDVIYYQLLSLLLSIFLRKTSSMGKGKNLGCF